MQLTLSTQTSRVGDLYQAAIPTAPRAHSAVASHLSDASHVEKMNSQQGVQERLFVRAMTNFLSRDAENLSGHSEDKMGKESEKLSSDANKFNTKRRQLLIHLNDFRPIVEVGMAVQCSVKTGHLHLLALYVVLWELKGKTM